MNGGSQFRLDVEWWKYYKSTTSVSPTDHVIRMRDMELNKRSTYTSLYTIDQLFGFVIELHKGLVASSSMESSDYIIEWRVCALILYEEEYGEYK